MPFSYADVAEMPYNYSGAKRAAYERELERRAGISVALAKYTMFVKCEILPNEPKAARIITAHNKAANTLFYPVAHGFEKSLLSVRDSQPGLDAPFFAKGMNFNDRAYWI